MNHERARAMLPAYLDTEVGPIRRFLLGRHIAHCPSCMAAMETLQSMRTALRTNLTVHRAPPALAARIVSALPRETPPVQLRRPPPAWGFGGAALAGGLVGVVLTVSVMRGPAPADGLIGDAVGDHVRSLMADHLTDVLTADRHTVKPWLSARLDLSPEVKDLAAEGYPLVGGRLDYVAGHRAAAMVYRRDRHVINLFAFVTDQHADAAPLQDSRDGFNVVRWRMNGISYVAVSDVEMGQLLAFARLVAAG